LFPLISRSMIPKLRWALTTSIRWWPLSDWWCSASYSHHPCDDFEPIDAAASPYRDAAVDYLHVLLATDEFLSTTDDPRLGWIAVAIVLKLTSVRGLTVANIANQLGVSAAVINRYTAKFARMANLHFDGAGPRRSPSGCARAYIDVRRPTARWRGEKVRVEKSKLLQGAGEALRSCGRHCPLCAAAWRRWFLIGRFIKLEGAE
jgi:hypothetical protein